MLISPKKRFRKVIIPPADKAITQRAIIASVLTGSMKIENPSLCSDAVSALDCVSALGARAKISRGLIEINAPSLNEIRSKKETYRLYAGNSATTARLMLGLVAGIGVKAQINGDSSLRRRTMRATLKALVQMGADFTHTKQKCPILVVPNGLNGISYTPKSPTAQIKSAVMLAALNAKGETIVQEPLKTRDHTEKMLSNLGFDIKMQQDTIRINPSKCALANPVVRVPGDMSSAAFMIGAALLAEDGYAHIKEVGLNPTRMGMVNLLINSGADIVVEHTDEYDGEAVGNITVRSGANLSAFELDALNSQDLIDEIPILAVIACFCNGTSVFRNLSLIKNKESNRMREIFKYLVKFGAQCTLNEDTLTIEGNGLKNSVPIAEPQPKDIKPKKAKKKATKINVRSKDHRIIMAFAVAGMVANGCNIEYPHLVNVSYREFFQNLLG